MATNFKDSRLTDIQAEEKDKLNDIDVQYGDMISQTDQYFKDAVNKIGVQDENGNWNKGSWAALQTDIQNQKTEFAIDEIEQHKEQAKKDYTGEQSGAYVDWQKQSDQYGANAEKMAGNGMLNTGYSESSQVGMYVAYQNRVATARESYNLLVQNYNNSITQARLANSSALAEIALQALEKGLDLSLQGLLHHNQLLSEQSDKKLAAQQLYQSKWRDTLDQINAEQAQALRVKEFEEGRRQFDEEMKRLKENDLHDRTLELQQLELQRAQLEEEKRQFDALNPTGGGVVRDDTTETTKVNKPVVTNGIRGYNPKSVVQSIAEPKIANRNGDGWIVIPGYGRMSYAEVYAYVQEGKIIESKDKNGDLKYTVKKGAKL